MFIVLYNVLGAVFRGMGDPKTPLLTVVIACAVNVTGDLLLVAMLHMGATGAALATVAAQGVSVLVSLRILRKKTLPFAFSKACICFDLHIIAKELRLGMPVALQELFVGVSFLVIQMMVKSSDVVPSAGVGVAEKVCAFVMLVPSAYMQSMSAFAAQNMGAGYPARAKKALRFSIGTALAAGGAMLCLPMFRGDALASVFSGDAAVVAAAHSYLKAYAIDCMLSPILFCFIGYYNGREKLCLSCCRDLWGYFWFVSLWCCC